MQNFNPSPPQDVEILSVSVAGPTDTALLKRFESIGPNCEFGFVQRYAGVEPLGLFRFSAVPADMFVRAARERFKGVEIPESIEIFEDIATKEWFSRIEPYGFIFHTGQFVGATNPETVKQEQKRRLPFLVRLFLHELETARRVFVRAGASTLEDITAISDAIGAYGRGVILWVTLSDEQNAPGSVRRVSDRLYIGYLDRFWTMDNNRFNGRLDQWMSICRNANAMVFDGIDVTVLGPTIQSNRPNQLAENVDRKTIAGCSGASPLSDTRFHVLTSDLQFPASGVEGLWVQKLIPDTVYISSLDVWIPATFTGRSVGLLFPGLKSIGFLIADLGVRDEWQTVWTSAKCPPSGTMAIVLAIEGSSGDMVFSRNGVLLEGCCL
jgi:hypothetical protein